MERGRVVHDVLSAFHKKVNAKLGRPGSPLGTRRGGVRIAARRGHSGVASAASREIRSRRRSARSIAGWSSSGCRTIASKSRNTTASGRDSAARWRRNCSRCRSAEAASLRPRPMSRWSSTAIAGPFASPGESTASTRACSPAAACSTCSTTRPAAAIRLTPESIAAGTTLQLPLYAIAAMELILNDRDAYPWRAGYWYVRDDGFKPRQALRMYDDIDGRIELDRQWEDIRAGLRDTVTGLVRSMRAGQFPVCSADEHCTGHCPFRTACRINQVRSLEKTWQPTLLGHPGRPRE